MDAGYIVTVAFMVAVAILIAAYDIFAAYHWGVKDTISDVTRGWNQHLRVVAYALVLGMGILVGHLFYNSPVVCKVFPWLLCVLIFAAGTQIGRRYLP